MLAKKRRFVRNFRAKRLISKGFNRIYLDQNGATHYRISPFAISKKSVFSERSMMLLNN
jgi:hypothetical protein